MLQASLSERITDCHVQKLSHTSVDEGKATEESDFSHINYLQAAAMVLEAKKDLEAEIAQRSSGHIGSNAGAEEDERSVASLEEVTKAEVNALKDLLNEATLSLAGILVKQGYVSAKFHKHHQALVCCLNLSCSCIFRYKILDLNLNESIILTILSESGFIWKFYCCLGTSSQYKPTARLQNYTEYTE